MVFFAPLVGAVVLLSGVATALPTNNYDSNSYNGGNNYNGGDNYNGGNNYNGGYDSKSSSTDMTTSSTTMMMDTSSTTMMMDTSSTTMMMETSSTTMMSDTTSSTTMMDTTSSTTMMMETSSTTEYKATSTPSYGSGSSNWGGNGYDDCVNQCIAKYGAPSMGGGGSYQATQTSGMGGYSGSGNGATHTVIVAPTKGVFRMMPFAVNASVGDVVEFHWGADNHTVTKSSALTPCNKSVADPVFASGEQNKGFVFRQVVNDTEPTFYYCGTVGHCEEGMFGVINPPTTAPGAPSSFAAMVPSMVANSSDLSAWAAQSTNATANNEAAAAWGSSFDLEKIPDWARSLFAANVYYTRATLGMNPEVLKADNSIDLSNVAATPLMLPTDLKDALASSNNAAPPSGASAPANAGSSPSTTSESAASSPSQTGAATAVTSSRLLVAAFVVVATLFAL